VLNIDNSYVVPYNPYLSLRYKAHINLEVVQSVQAVKYLFKYVTKGQDRILMRVDGGNKNDEVERFLNARYVSASEALWRLYGFELHQRHPSVEKLPCHLPEQQTILFQNVEEAQASIQGGPPVTKLQAYFDTNRRDADARRILYVDYPQFFTWNQHDKQWRRRKLGVQSAENGGPRTDKIGRIPTITLSPHQSELFYLRMLLFNRSGATSFEDLRTIEDAVCPTFQEACRLLGLLDDDTEIDLVMEEASSIRFGDQLRNVFVTILLYVRPSDPPAFWLRHKEKLCQDIRHRNGATCDNELIENEVLIYLQEKVQQENLDISVDFNLPRPDLTLQPMSDVPRDIRDETLLDVAELEDRISNNIDRLTEEQRLVYDAVVKSVMDEDGLLFCLDAFGGTGKTFLINMILDKVRSLGKVALATATSGIAATLLHLGRTLHSRFKVPIKCTEDSTCAVTKRSVTGRLIKMAKLLIIDEVSMGHKNIYEAVSRTCQDIKDNKSLFGGLTVLFSGDFRQILPVIPHGSRAVIVNSCLKASHIWGSVRQMKLTKNMRVEVAGGKITFILLFYFLFPHFSFL
jgi:hypothetical protein